MNNINRLKSTLTGFLHSINLRVSLIKTRINSIEIKKILTYLLQTTRLIFKRIITNKVTQVILITVPFFAIYGIYEYFNFGEEGIHKLFLYFGIYLGLFLSTTLLPDNKIGNVITFIILIPYILSIIFLPFIELVLLFIIVFFTPLVFISMFIDKVPEAIFDTDLLFGTKLYLMLTISSILISVFAESIIVKFIPLWNSEKEDNRISKRVEFTLSLINRGVIKYTIYFSFFLLLIIFSVAKFNQIDIFENQDVMNVILTSFATFIAFDRLTLNKDLINMNPKGVLKKLVNLYRAEIDK